SSDLLLLLSLSLSLTLSLSSLTPLHLSLFLSLSPPIYLALSLSSSPSLSLILYLSLSSSPSLSLCLILSLSLLLLSSTLSHPSLQVFTSDKNFRTWESLSLIFSLSHCLSLSPFLCVPQGMPFCFVSDTLACFLFFFNHFFHPHPIDIKRITVVLKAS